MKKSTNKTEKAQHYVPTWAEIKEMYAEIANSQKETDRIVKETAVAQKETDRLMKELRQEVSGIAKSNGEFAEEYFANVFETDKKFGNVVYDNWNLNLKGKAGDCEGEYDIVLINGSSVAIIETKYKPRVTDVDKMIENAKKFRTLFPYYQNHKVYLGLAGLSFSNNIIGVARKRGIAVIRQRGNKTIVNDDNLRAY